MRRAWPTNEVNQRKVEHEEERDQVLKTSFKTLGPAFPEAITPRLSVTRTDKVSFPVTGLLQPKEQITA